jgi:hypothetical protein
MQLRNGLPGFLAKLNARGPRQGCGVGGNITKDFRFGLVAGTDLARHGIQVEDALVAPGIPRFGIVLHGIEPNREDNIRGIKQTVTTLVFEKSDPADECGKRSRDTMPAA